MKNKKVILDTNFLLIPAQFKVDVFTQIEELLDEPFVLCVVDKTISELNKLCAAGREKDRFAARLGLVLLRQKNLKTLRSFSRKNTDDIILKKSDKNTYVATQDRALREKLRKKGAGIIGLRQKKYLVIS